MKCPKCGRTDHEPGAKFCYKDGTKLMLITVKCPNCNATDHKPGTKFCQWCGTELINNNEPPIHIAEPPKPRLACPKCGNTNILPGSKFCNECGTRLGVTDPQSSETDNTSSILHLADDQLYPIRRNGRWGYMNKTGEILFMVERNVDCAFHFKEDVARFAIDNKNGIQRRREGFIDKAGKVTIEPLFERVYDFTNERSIASIYGQAGVIDKRGDWVIEPRHKGIWQPFPKIFLYGGYLYDLDGNKVKLPFFPDRFGDVSEGLLPVCDYDYEHDSDKWGFVNDKGEVVIEPQFDDVDTIISFKEGLCAVRIKRKWGYINRTGRMVIKKQFDKAGYFRNGLALVELRGQNGIIDKSGKMIFESQKEMDFWSFQGVDFGIIKNIGSCTLIDRTGRKIREIHDVNFYGSRHGLMSVKSNSNSLYGLLDAKGEQLIPCKYEKMYVLSDNLVAIEINEKWGLVDAKDRMIVNPQFDYISDDGYDLLSVMKDGKMGYIDRTGVTIYQEL